MTKQITSAGSDPIAVMAALRSSCSLSLGEARELLKHLPCPLPTPTHCSQEEFLSRLQAAGASVSRGGGEHPESDTPQPRAPKENIGEIIDAVKYRAVDAQPKRREGITKITVTDPGKKRMQLVPLLKTQMGFTYSQAASIAEKGGELTHFPTQEAAREIVRTMTALGVQFNAE